MSNVPDDLLYTPEHEYVARTGDPGWPRYDLDRRATQRFDTTLEVMHDPMGDERALWTDVI